MDLRAWSIHYICTVCRVSSKSSKDGERVPLAGVGSLGLGGEGSLPHLERSTHYPGLSFRSPPCGLPGAWALLSQNSFKIAPHHTHTPHSQQLQEPDEAKRTALKITPGFRVQFKSHGWEPASHPANWGAGPLPMEGNWVQGKYSFSIGALPRICGGLCP